MMAEILALIRPWKLEQVRELPLNGRDSENTRQDALQELVSEENFRKVLTIERKRVERSERRFVLMLVHTGELSQSASGDQNLARLADALAACIRETDLSGWYKHGSVMGVLCTEIGTGELPCILNALHAKVTTAIRNRLEPEPLSRISVSFQVFPGEFKIEGEVQSAQLSLSPSLEPNWSNNPPNYAVARLASAS